MDTTDTLVTNQDSTDLHAHLEPYAEFPSKLAPRRRNGGGSTPGIPNALLSLHIGESAKDGGRLIGGRTDVLCEMVQHLRHTTVR